MTKAKTNTFKENVGKCFCNLRVHGRGSRTENHREHTKGSDDGHQLN